MLHYKELYVYEKAEHSEYVTHFRYMNESVIGKGVLIVQYNLVVPK